jgi:hypothetical protein
VRVLHGGSLLWGGKPQGEIDMKIHKKAVVHSAAAAAVISVLVSVVGAGTKWMGH